MCVEDNKDLNFFFFFFFFFLQSAYGYVYELITNVLVTYNDCFKTAGFGSEVIFRQVSIAVRTVAAPVLGCATCSPHIVKLGA